VALDRVIGIGILLSLKDKLSGPVFAADSAMQGLNKTTDAAVNKNKALQNAFNLSASAMAAGGGMLTALGATAYAASNVQSVMMDVSQASGIVGADMDALQSRVTKLSGSLGMSADQFGAIAVVAAKVGRETNMGAAGIEKLSTTAAKLSRISADLSGPQAIQGLARLSAIYGIDLPQNADKLASVLTHLAQTTDVTEGEILAMTVRLGPMAKAMGLTFAETAAFSSGLNKLGIPLEQGAMGLQNILALMANSGKIGAFSKQLGMTVPQYKALVKENPAQAMAKFFQSLKGVDKMKVDATLKRLGLASNKTKGLVLGMAASSDTLAESLASASGAFNAGTALQEEFDQKSGTLAMKMAELKANLFNVGATIGKFVLPVVTKIVSAFTWFLSIIMEIPGPILAAVAAMTGLVGTILLVGGAVGMASVAVGFLTKSILANAAGTSLARVAYWLLTFNFRKARMEAYLYAKNLGLVTTATYADMVAQGGLTRAIWSGLVARIRDTAATIASIPGKIAATAATWAQAAATRAAAASARGATITTLLWKAAMWLLNIAMYANPIGLIVLAIVAFVAVAALAVKATGSTCKWVRYLGYAILIALGPLGALIAAAVFLYRNFKKLSSGGSILTKIFAPLRAAWDKLKVAWDSLMEALAPAFAVFKKIFNAVLWVAGFVVGFFLGRFSKMLSFLVSVITWVVGAITEGIKAIVWIISAPGEAFAALWDAIKIVGKGILNALIWPFKKAFEFITNIYSALFGVVMNPINAIKDSIMTAINALWNFVRKIISKIPDFLLPKSLESIKADYKVEVAAKGPSAAPEEVAMAEGGVVTSPTRALIGERGPEAVIPLGRGGGVGLRLRVTVPVSIDGREVFRVIKEYEAEESARSFEMPLRLATTP
jgi:TP901 family phage tail tape measure protein